MSCPCVLSHQLNQEINKKKLKSLVGNCPSVFSECRTLYWLVLCIVLLYFFIVSIKFGVYAWSWTARTKISYIFSNFCCYLGTNFNITISSIDLRPVLSIGRNCEFISPNQLGFVHRVHSLQKTIKSFNYYRTPDNRFRLLFTPFGGGHFRASPSNWSATGNHSSAGLKRTAQKSGNTCFMGNNVHPPRSFR